MSGFSRTAMIAGRSATVTLALETRLQRGADVDAATNAGETTLLRAVFCQDRQMVDLLVTSGAKPDAVSDHPLADAGFRNRAGWDQRVQDVRAGR